MHPLLSAPIDETSSRAADRNAAIQFGWPPASSVADLGRILLILHGANAPSDAMLKKWSAAGEFRDCLATGSLVARGRPGRRGMQLATDKAIARVHELWPQLAESDAKAIFEQAVVRTAHQLSAAIRPLVGEALTESSSGSVRGELARAELAEQTRWRERIELGLAAMSQEIKDLRREMAQFTALRNNLVTRLDEVIVRSRESAAQAGREAGIDPIAEARRERDMRAMKASLDRIVDALERNGSVSPGASDRV